MSFLLYNAILTPDGTILQSRSRHDYVQHLDTISGELYILDGGLAYQRTSVNKEPFKNLAVYTSDPHEVIREVFSWGSYGKDGNSPKKYILLKDLTDLHIAAILRTQTHLPDEMRKVFQDELQYRDVNECNILVQRY